MRKCDGYRPLAQPRHIAVDHEKVTKSAAPSDNILSNAYSHSSQYWKSKTPLFCSEAFCLAAGRMGANPNIPLQNSPLNTFAI